MKDLNYNRLMQECFWDMNMSPKNIQSIVATDDLVQKKFLFRKILLNSSRLLTDLRLFDAGTLKILIESFQVPSFNHDYIFRKHNIVEVYFLDMPLHIDELKWVA
ncbi:MAG: hypothetical protein DRQ78_08835 [Epsilonproteobacteria bacterium]|nr:MAG: hypothetical protein DRQ78_08835 [Campylobacterota bacterium]